MSYEMCYTSAPRGLRIGASGFCTVGLTRGTPAMLVERLESLSGYRPLFPASSPQASQNPVSWAHWRVTAGGQSFSVLSRVCFAGLDHTQRSNKFAHHIALSAGECPAGGPAWTLAQPGVMRNAWVGLPEEYDSGPALPAGDESGAACTAWASACGDAGWAGILVDAFVNAPLRPVYLIYPLQLDVLPLIREALALMPAPQRWQVTFNTYYTDMPAGSSCAWRCCAAGSPAAEEALHGSGMVIDLSARLPRASDSRYVRAARDGTAANSFVDRQEVEPERVSLLDTPDDEIDLSPVTSGSLSAARSQQSFKRPALAPANRAAANALPGDFPPLSGAKSAPPARGPAAAEPKGPSGSRGSSLVMWLAVGVLWTAIVGAGVYAFMRARVGDDVDRANVEIDGLKSQAASNADNYAALKRSFDESQKLQRQLATDRDAARESFRAAEPDRSQIAKIGDRQKAEMAQQVDAQVAQRVHDAVKKATDELNRKFQKEKEKWSAASVAAVAPATIPEASREDKEFAGLLPQMFPSVEGLPFPYAGASPIALKLQGRAGGQQLHLAPVDGISSECQFDPSTGKIFRANSGGFGTTDLCSLAVQDNALTLDWPALTKNDDDLKRKAFLRTCLLTIGAGATAQAVQFAAPSSIQFNMSEEAFVKFSSDAPGRLIFPSSSPWQLDPKDSLKAQLSVPGRPLITISAQRGRLSSSFFKMLSEKNAELAKGEAAWLGSIAALPKKDGTVDFEKLRSEDMSKTRAALEQKSEELVQARKEVNELKDPRIFPPSPVAVEAKNGVIVCIINLAVSK